MKKKFFIFCLLLFVFCLTGCGAQKTVDPASKEEKSNRPVAKGIAFETKELEFYLPEGFLKSPTNGMLGVFEFYTGEWKDAGPTGIDCMILLDSIDESFSIEDYVQTSAPALAEGISLEKKTINDSTWYVGESEKVHYYYASFRGHKYEVKITLNGEDNDLYDQTIQMFEKTMYFEELDEK